MKKNSLKKPRNPWNAALKILAVSPVSSEDLKNKLLKKEFSKTEIGEVLEKAKKYKFLNDDAYALNFAQKELAKLRGPLRIENSLAQRGIRPELAARALQTLGAHEPRTQCDIAQKAIEKKFQRKPLSRNAVYRFLTAQGFSEEIVHKFTGEEEF